MRTKQYLFLTLFTICTLLIVGQEVNQGEDKTFSFSTVAKEMRVVSPTFDEPINSINEDGKTYVVRNKMRRNKFTNSKNALPKGGDPLLNNNKSSHPNKAPIMNWDGLSSSQSGGASPPDPSGAVGPNHYVQMVNSVYRIFDKSGNAVTAPAALGSLLGGGNAGDPIVMYDKFADRWFLSQFKGFPQGEIFVAVSQTSDPAGAYNLYEFDLGSFPDYPKYSIWSDGYYITSNKSGDNAFVMERDKMIAGDPTAQLIAFNIPSLNTGGFYSVLPATASSTLPPLGTPNYLFYFQDDAWSGGNDELKIWEVNVDWATTSNSSISAPQSLTVSPFDSEFNTQWDDITQPGTNAKIDAVPGALMYMGHYRSFGTHNSIVLNHTVDVNGANLAGIRWYELRQSGTNPWTLHQEGTFSPDSENRWMGSIAMDYQGNIGLAYSVSGATTFPSLKYTGRYANDPLGQMTLNEEVIVNGSGVETGIRFGDYAQMTIDPTDDATFWFTGEYIANEWKTRIASFKIANDADDDLGVSAVTSPVDGTLTSSESIVVNISNYGLNDQSNFPISYQIDGGGVITETYVGTITAGSNASFTFNATADLSSIGAYNIKSFTGLVADQFNNNDTVFYRVKHLGNDDVGVTSITSPVSSNSLGNNETITVSIKNFGVQSQTSFPISYQINGGAIITETYPNSLAPNASVSYSFTTTADLSSLGVYSIYSFTGLVGDTDLLNDTSFMEVEHEMCLPSGDCSFNDGFIKIELSNLVSNTNCSPNGYGDYTSDIINLERSVMYDLKIQSGYADQHGTVWIDFNDNFTFEPSEIVLSNVLFGTSIASFDLTIPNNSTIGEHLIRFRTNYDADINDGCIDVNYGETEDYTANVIAFTGVDEKYKNIELNIISNTNKQLAFEVTNTTEELNIEITNSIGQRIISDSFKGGEVYKADISNYTKGYYLLRVSNANMSKIRKVWIQ